MSIGPLPADIKDTSRGRTGIWLRQSEFNVYNHILVALDGSQASLHAGQSALALALATGARVTACHVYGVQIHQHRFSDMEPGLPSKYHAGQAMEHLRSTHDRLMNEGFQALSTGYIKNFVIAGRAAGVAVEAASLEGRSYVGIVRLAQTRKCDLIVLGADGMGAVGDHMLGGTTTRVLHSAPCDVLVVRRAPDNGPIFAGVDGSAEALKAVAHAVDLANAMKKPIHLIAVYDPDFHTRVFAAITESLSPEVQQQAGLASQEELHDSIINDGLGKLYADFLSQAQHRFNTNGTTIKTFLLTGKAYSALDAQAADSNADLVVVSRHGQHRQRSSRLGSNAEGLLRTTSANVLLVGGVDDPPNELEEDHQATTTIPSTTSLRWEHEAEKRLERVPSFVRAVAKNAVENAVRESGKQHVSAGDFDAVAARFGMAPAGDGA